MHDTMKQGPVSLAAALALALAACARPAAAAHGRSPHVEIEATAVVDTAPRRTVHGNGRSYEEFEARIEAARTVPDGRDSDPGLPIDRERPVHVVHDLSCGGDWVSLRAGSRVHLKGEYVHPRRGKDIVHFTHPADSRCGHGGRHADGFLRPAAPR